MQFDRRMLRLTAVAFVGWVSFSACSSDGSGGDSVFPGSVPYDANPTTTVLQYSVGGGFSGAGFAWGGLPVLALYGDGRLIFSDVPANPLSHQIRETRATSGDIQRVLKRADDLGLFAKSTTDFQGVDADTATLTLRATTKCVTHRQSPPPATGPVATIETTLRDLLAGGTVAAAAKPWEYASVAVTYNWTDDSVDCSQARTWPIEPPASDAPIDEASCRVVDRQAASSLASAPTETDRLLAVHGTRCLAYSFRPLLPGEAGCTATSPATCAE